MEKMKNLLNFFKFFKILRKINKNFNFFIEAYCWLRSELFQSFAIFPEFRDETFPRSPVDAIDKLVIKLRACAGLKM